MGGEFQDDLDEVLYDVRAWFYKNKKKIYIALTGFAILFVALFALSPAHALSTGDSMESVKTELHELRKSVPDAEILTLNKEQADNFFSVLGTKPPMPYDELVLISSKEKGLATLIVLNEGKVVTAATMPYEIYAALLRQAMLIEENNGN